MPNSERPNRIVYVDDDFEIRQLVRKAYEKGDPKHKIVMATCGSGKEMLSRLNELQPNLILLDLQMPEMSGPDTLDYLRANKDGKDIPVIFMTGKTKIVMQESYKALGVLGIIYKPFDIDTLPDQILKIWEQRFGETNPNSDGRVLRELMEDDSDSFSAD
ncbi:MAG: response regulator [Alphaproteobacteria bacterium]|nr:response regulator [Alphaproteobacteria bacterium]